MDLHPILERLQALESRSAATRRAPGDRAAETPAAAFAAQGRLPLQDLAVRVADFGALDAPLAATDAARLHRASRPAKFGHRERTLLDASVRHTGEIAADAVELAWPAAQREAVLREVADALGTGPLEARLHALLVYGPGQFFKPHQDTEKHDGMVGTLVLAWPSAHIGGPLRVRHGSGEFAFSSQQLGHSSELRWCAFYADCRHEVLPVEEGWRVALTFDLVVPAAAAGSGGDAAPDARLQELLQAEFGTDGPPRLQPWALLLDHEYTEHGLRWHLLKGPDRARVAALRAAARPLGLSLHLALAELHQTWSAEHPDGLGRRGRPSGAPEPGELIDSSLTLDHWVDEDGGTGSRHAMSIAEDDLHGFSDTDEAYLVDEQYEGYMGNWGETLDYWYRRAALVVQSPAAAERSCFQRDPVGVLNELQALASHRGQAEELARRHARLGDLIAPEGRLQDPARLQACAAIAAALPDAEAAKALMAGFEPAAFTPADAPALAGLQAARGPEWLQSLWDGWALRAAQAPGWTARAAAAAAGGRRSGLWPDPAPDFVRAGLDAGLAPELLARVMGVHALDALALADRRRAAQTPAQRLAGQAHALEDACAAAAALRTLPQTGPHLARLLRHVADHPQLYPPVELAPLVVAAGAAAANRWPPGTPLRARTVAALQAALERPPAAPDDHGVRNVEWVCACADCLPVRRWAESPGNQPLVLAMAEARRGHVVQALRDAGAPISSQTLRQGSPHKLRLDKAADLHAREHAARRRWGQALEGLVRLEE